MTQATDADVSTLIRLASDGAMVGKRTVPRVDDVLIINGVGIMLSDLGVIDPDFDTMTGYDLTTLQTLWREKSFTFNKQVIGDRLYLGDISWSTGAKAIDPTTGVITKLVAVRDPFQIGGSEEFDLQVISTQREAAWSPYFATCEGLRRNDSVTGKTMWTSDLPFHVSATLRDRGRLFVAGSRDAEHRYVIELDWNTGKLVRSWAGVPQISELHRVKGMLIGYELAGELVAIRLDDH